MTSPAAPSRIVLVLGLSFSPSCYAPHDPIVASDSGAASDGEGSGESDNVSSSGSSATLTTTTSDPDTGPSDSNDTTGSDTEGTPICGDGVVEGDEVCDDGVNDGSYGGCGADCAVLGPHCGDGTEQEDEICDDGDQNNGDGCNIDCVVSGSVLWTQTFAGGAGLDDQIAEVAVDADGMIVAAGWEALSPSTRRAWMRRFAPDGVEDWTAVYAGAVGAYTEARGLAIDEDGSIYVGGRYDAGAEGNNGWARKHDDSSTVEYTHLFNGAANEDDAVYGIAVSPDGYAVIVGTEMRTDLGQGQNVFVRRLGQDGSELWTRTYAGAGNEIAYDVAIDGEGSIVVVGVTPVDTETDIWIRKYDQDGGTSWTRTHDAGATDTGYGVAVGASNRISVVGTTDEGDATSIWLGQYDEDGTLIWDVSHDSGNDAGFLADNGRAVAVDSESNVITSGVVVTDAGTGFDARIAKYTADGNELWANEAHIGVPDSYAYSYPHDLAVDAQGNIIVGGSEVLDGTADHNGWIRKLAP